MVSSWLIVKVEWKSTQTEHCSVAPSASSLPNTESILIYAFKAKITYLRSTPASMHRVYHLCSSKRLKSVGREAFSMPFPQP